MPNAMMNIEKQVQVHLVPWRVNTSIMVPSSAVAEVLYNMDMTPIARPKNWIKGVIQWRGLPVPLMSFRRIAHRLPDHMQGESSRVLICRTLGYDNSYSHFAIEFFRLPRHQIIYEHSMTLIEAESDAEEWPFSARVRLAEQDVYVLDIQKLCQLLTA